MKRSMFQLYVNNCEDAIKFYERAFNTSVDFIYRSEQDNTIIHSEMNIFGQCIAFSERASETVPGNTMQLCLHFDDGSEELVEKIYDVLKEEAEILHPLGECFFSPLMSDLIDKYGVHWCIFI